MKNQSEHFEDPFEKADQEEAKRAKKKKKANPKAEEAEVPVQMLDLNEAEKQWATLIHLSGFAGFLLSPLGFIFGPLILWHLKKEEMPAIDPIGKEVVNFQITMVIAYAIAAILVFIVIGMPLLAALAVYHIIVMVMGAIASSKGEMYRYPKSIQFIK